MNDKIEFIRNGQKVSVADITPTDTLLDHLRLTEASYGTKEGCGEGDCGACTVVLGRQKDGKMHYRPVNSCIYLLGMADGQEVITVDDLTKQGQALHPIQQSMVDHHAAQCGFCTPGFVMALFALYHSEQDVSRDTITTQLAGNLCRCTGYRPIVDAGLEACSQQPADQFAARAQQTAKTLADMPQQDLYIGNDDRFFAAPKSINSLAALYQKHPDATIVSGATDVGLWITKRLMDLPKIIYIGEVSGLDHVLIDDDKVTIGAAVTYANAMDAIGGLDADIAETMRRIGSKQVRESGTIGGNIANGSPIGDMPPILIAMGAEITLQKADQTRSIKLEDYFIAVVAKTRNQARHAAKKAKIIIEATTPLITAKQGRAANSKVQDPYNFTRGNVDADIKSAPHQLSETLLIGGQEHFYLEGQIAMAIPKDEGEMHIFSGTQHPAEVQHTVAKMLGVQDAAIVCETRRMGGAFGGKETQGAQWAAIAALAAHVTGKPAKMRLDRDDDMIMTGKRHDFDCQWSVGFDAKGIIQAVKVNYDSRCGNSADISSGVNDRSMFHTDNAYFYPACDITNHRVKTNTVSNTAFRGFGGPQGVLFAERMIEGIAIQTGHDALDVRKANFYRKDKDITPYGMQVKDNIIAEIITELEKSSDYRARRQAIKKYNQTSPYLKKGLALTPVKFGIAFTLKHLNQAGALAHVYSDGSVQINHGGTEMGQGLNTKVAQVVAETFGIDLSSVKITATTTDKVPNATPTAASSGSDLNGKAAQNAAQKIKQRMTTLAAKLYNIAENKIHFKNNKVICGQFDLSFADLAQKAFLERISLSATGFYATPNITWDREKKTGRPFLYFSYGASCSEVIIDTLTGEMKVTRVDILHDVGTSLNPAIDLGQIEGGFVQGMGWLTTEELVFDDKGRLATHAPSTYKIPTAFDVPEDFRVNLNPSTGNMEDTIYKSKAIGEPPVMLACSVYCAVLDAVASCKQGTIPNLPAPTTPEAILTAIKNL